MYLYIFFAFTAQSTETQSKPQAITLRTHTPRLMNISQSNTITSHQPAHGIFRTILCNLPVEDFLNSSGERIL